MAKYIDAERLLAEAKNLSGPITGDGWDNFGVYSMIERQLAADVRENVHGKWILCNALVSDTLCCSECEFNVLPDEAEVYRFCPNCGADMRGDENG